MEYYIEPARQNSEISTDLADITHSTVNPEELSLIDPACGSGHILVEAYDLFKSIYQEHGLRDDLPTFVLQKNLFGLDIDDRAAQLASFSLMMKARSDDRNIFCDTCNRMFSSIHESKQFDCAKITEAINRPLPSTDKRSSEDLFEHVTVDVSSTNAASVITSDILRPEDVAQLITLFRDGKTVGSLVQVTPATVAERLTAIAERVEAVVNYGGMFERAAATQLKPLVQQALVLSSTYDAVVTNPPYMGNKLMNASLNAFAAASFPAESNDLFAMFIRRCTNLADRSGLVGLVTPFVWMFIPTYETFQESPKDDHNIVTCSIGVQRF